MHRSQPLPLLLGFIGCTLLHGATVAVAAPVRRPASPTADPPTRAVPDSAWQAVRERDVSLRMRGGLEASGRLIADDADTVTLIQAGGSVATIPKSDVEALRVVEPAEAPPPPPPPRSSAPSDAPETSDEPEGFRKSGGYVLLSPGAISQQFSLGSDSADGYSYDYGDDSHTFFQWGLGVGGYLATKGAFAFAGGLSLQHATAKLDEGDGATLRGNIFRIGPEFRIGGSGKRFFAYGIVDLHGTVYRDSFKADGEKDSYSQAGFGGTFGAGALGLIGKRFLLGGELKAPVDRLFENDNFNAQTMVAIDVRFLLGVKF